MKADDTLAIPEHDKCVRLHKWLRHDLHFGNWKKVRAMRRKNGTLKPKFRIKNYWKAFDKKKEMVETPKRFGFDSYTAMNKHYRGKYYKKYGKYDD